MWIIWGLLGVFIVAGIGYVLGGQAEHELRGHTRRRR